MQSSLIRRAYPENAGRSTHSTAGACSAQIRRVLLVGGNPNLLDTKESVASGGCQPELQVAADRASLVRALAKGPFDAAIVDTETLPYSAHQLSRFIRASAQETRLIVLANYSDINDVTNLLDAGCNTLLDRKYFIETLLALPDCWSRLTTCQFSPDVSQLIFDTLSDYQVMFGGACNSEQAFSADVTPNITPTHERVDEPTLLTARESELLRLGAQGLEANKIATQLHLSSHTVNTHLKNIYRKLGVNRRGDAITRARELGEI